MSKKRNRDRMHATHHRAMEQAREADEAANKITMLAMEQSKTQEAVQPEPYARVHRGEWIKKIPNP